MYRYASNMYHKTDRNYKIRQIRIQIYFTQNVQVMDTNAYKAFYSWSNWRTMHMDYWTTNVVIIAMVKQLLNNP